MFTGIIKEIGTVESVRRKGGSLELRVQCPESAVWAEPGDSIAVEGICLTVTSIDGGAVEMDVGEETFNRTTLSGVKPRSRVNIEPALRLGDKMGGHWVAGHVDAAGKIVSVSPEATQVTVAVRFPRELARFIAPKGSIAVDGISLTVGAVSGDRFEVYIIPHTMEQTTMQFKRAGDAVNLEADVLARYVVNAMKHPDGSGGKLLEKLKEYDYLGETT